MTFKKWLVAFLILLSIFLLTTVVYSGPGDEPVKEHPWDEVKSNPTIIKQPYSIATLVNTYFYSVLPFNSGVFVLVVDKKQEVIKKDLSVKNYSLPRKK